MECKEVRQERGGEFLSPHTRALLDVKIRPPIYMQIG